VNDERWYDLIEQIRTKFKITTRKSTRRITGRGRWKSWSSKARGGGCVSSV
jgi:hypothetical protein